MSVTRAIGVRPIRQDRGSGSIPAAPAAWAPFLCAAALAVALPGAQTAHAAEASLAVGELQGGEVAGIVFFLAVARAPGAVAVGAAHAFDPTRLAESGHLRFRAGAGVAATSTRYFTRPGPAFHERGATLRAAFVTFSLTRPPRGVRVLEPAARAPEPGGRVRVLGRNRDGSESAVFGTVVRGEPDRIEIDLDAWADLRGWGGAPVFSAAGADVVGLLQSAWPANGTLRVGVGPIGGIVQELAAPLDGGLGRLFATLAPTPSAANSPAARRRAATGSARGYLPPQRNARLVAAARGAPQAIGSETPRILQLEIDHPPPDSVVGDRAGVFLVGRARALPSAARRFDIVIAIDTSESTNQPAGVDVDGDHNLGEAIPNERRGLTDPASTDPGDSILAAEVAAARRLLDGLDPRTTRVGLVTFAGQALWYGDEDAPRLQVKQAALAHEPLTSDYRRLDRALDRIAERGGKGMTFMAAGIDQASLELLGLEGALSGTDRDSEKVILFLTDGQPTLPDVRSEAVNVRAVMAAAQRARGAEIRIYAFAIGPEALAGPVAAVEMAEISGGSFVPVRHLGHLAHFVERESFARIESVEVRNTTSGERAYHVRVHPDGSWDALVPLDAGLNDLEVRARSADGATATQTIAISHRSGATGPLLPIEWVPKHNRQLELRLADLRAENLEALRKELTLEREREAALHRAARQRKELELEVEGALPPQVPSNGVLGGENS